MTMAAATYALDARLRALANNSGTSSSPGGQQ
jgi:hypothetical protein